MHHTCPGAKQRNPGLASVWIQLAEPQYVCLSGSQVEQLATTTPLLHVHNHHQTERMTARDPNRPPSPSWDRWYRSVQIGTRSLNQWFWLMFPTIGNSIIAAACERDWIPSWVVMENKWRVETWQRRGNVAALWNMRDEVNLWLKRNKPQAGFQFASVKGKGEFSEGDSTQMRQNAPDIRPTAVLGFLGPLCSHALGYKVVCPGVVAVRRPVACETSKRLLGRGWGRPRWSGPGGAFQLINRGSECHCQQTELIHELTVKVPGAYGRSGCGSRFQTSHIRPLAPSFFGGIIDSGLERPRTHPKKDCPIKAYSSY